MIFICQKQQLLDSILIVQKAITGKPALSVLEGIYLEANPDNTLTLIGSDKDMSIKTIADTEVETVEAGKIVIDSRMFGEIIKSMPNSNIKIQTTENQILRITCEKSVFDLAYMNADEFPKLPEIENDLKVTISQNVLKNMIRGTLFAVAKEETRPIFQGILFELKNNALNLVALDGYRLAVKTEFLEEDKDIEAIIPGKNLSEVSKILADTDETVEITFTKNHILFNLENTQIISTLLEGKFINYNSLIPDEHRLVITADRVKLLNAIERASLMGKEGNTNLVKFDVINSNLIISSNSQIGKVREELTIDLEEGSEIQIAFNSKYMVDVLKNLDREEVVLKMSSSISPCVLEEKNNNTSQYLVLPVRLAN